MDWGGLLAAFWAAVTACWHWLVASPAARFEALAFASPSLNTMITFWAFALAFDECVRTYCAAVTASAK